MYRKEDQTQFKINIKKHNNVDSISYQIEVRPLFHFYIIIIIFLLLKIKVFCSFF